MGLLDRVNRKIDMYDVSSLTDTGGSAIFSDSLNVVTSVHHILGVPNAQGQDKNLFYAVAEGSPKNGIPPALVAFEVSGTNLIEKETLSMPIKNVDGTMKNVEDMGSHHASFHPDGEHIYLGSAEGFTYVINRVIPMQIVATIETGKGNGHTTMSPMGMKGRMIGVSTNHDDTFMTIIDLNTHSKIQDIVVSSTTDENKKRKAQAHTSSFDPENDQYFYTAASHEGRIIEIDLNMMKVTRELPFITTEYPESYPIQGTFIWPVGG